MAKKDFKRMISCYGYTREDKSIKKWMQIASFKKVFKNYIIFTLSRFIPDSSFKNHLYRKTGLKLGKNVSLFAPNFDVFFPEMISVGDNTVIGNMTSILAHEFLVHEWRKGPVKIGKNVMIGAMTLVLPGVTIGDGATIAAYSLVNRNVEPGDFVGGVPIKTIRKPKKK